MTTGTRSSHVTAPSASSKAAASSPPWAKPGCALVVLGDLQLGVDRAALAGRQQQVQPGGVVGAAPEALAVVTAEGGAGGWGVGVSLRRHGVLRRFDRTPAFGLLAHGWTLPAQRGSAECHPDRVPPASAPLPVPRRRCTTSV